MAEYGIRSLREALELNRAGREARRLSLRKREEISPETLKLIFYPTDSPILERTKVYKP